MMEKSNGQVLYEYEHPKSIKVIRYEDRFFPNKSAWFMVDNPYHQTPWNMLTGDCQKSWEKSSIGHHLFGEQQ